MKVNVRISNINKFNNPCDSKYYEFKNEESARRFLLADGFKFVCADAATKPSDYDCIKYVEAIIY